MGHVTVVLALAMLRAAASGQFNATTVDEYFLENYGQSTQEVFYYSWETFAMGLDIEISSYFEKYYQEGVTWLPLMNEVLQYLKALPLTIISEFASDLANVSVESIYKDINDHCAEYLEAPIEDLAVEPSNVTCMSIQLRKMLKLKLKVNIQVGLQNLSGECIQHLLPFCSRVDANCTLAYEERVGKLLDSYIEDKYEVKHPSVREMMVQKLVNTLGPTPQNIIYQFMINTVDWVTEPYRTATSYLTLTSFYIFTAPSIEPFSVENILHPRTNKDGHTEFYKEDSPTQSKERLTWGIVTSNVGSVDHPCSNYRGIYPRDSEEYSSYYHRCAFLNMYQSTFDLIRCAYTDPTTRPLTWYKVPSVYFHSQCLCLAYNSTECGVKEPQGVDPRIYCLFVLLRDFQRQVSYRPAVTYLDYAFQTRVPVCKFSNLLQIGFKRECEDYKRQLSLKFILSMQCYFKGRFNKHLNCSDTPLVIPVNQTVLCGLEIFMEYVVCDGDGDVKVGVPYYGTGRSTLVLGLTFIDVAVRVLTLITYLACPQLRNLPGKLLIGYQVTALLRLLVVRASLADMALAVRLDVAMDLASTLWLTSYLHFLTTSIMTLRLASLSRDEARMVLLRYAMLGWALPAALSATFFSMDEALDSRVQIGQLLFVLCNYVALCGNLYMFYKNFQFYYDVKKSALRLRQGVTARSVYADLFNFALKTSLLSGAGITFRLVFTQIQGLEHLLDYYHALGTLHGLLFFFLYGCNSEARAFWKLVVMSILPLCTGRQNNSD